MSTLATKKLSLGPKAQAQSIRYIFLQWIQAIVLRHLLCLSEYKCTLNLCPNPLESTWYIREYLV